MDDFTPQPGGDMINVEIKGRLELNASENPCDNMVSFPTIGEGALGVDDIYKNMPESRLPSGAKIEQGQNESTLPQLNWSSIERVLSPAPEEHTKLEISLSDAASKKLLSDSKHPIGQEMLPKLRKEHKTGEQVVKLKKQLNMALGKKNKLRKSKKQDHKTSKQPGENPASAIKNVCEICGVESPGDSKSICKSCMRRQKKEKPIKMLGTSTSKKVLKTRSGTPASQTDPEGESCTSSISSQSMVSFDLQDYRFVSLGDTETDTRVKESKSQTLSCDVKTISDQNDYSKALSTNSLNIIASLKDDHKTVDDLIIKDKVDDSTILKTEKKQPGTKYNGINRPSMKRSTTDSEIVGKCKSKRNNETSADVKATGNECPEVQLHALDSYKRKDSAKEFNSRPPGRKTRESSDPNLVSHRKTASSDNMNEGSNKTAPFKFERSKTTFGKVFHERERKSTAESEKARTESNVVSLETDKLLVATEPRNKKFLNPSRAHTVIGDGNTKRQKPKSENTKQKSAEKPEHSFSSDTKEKRKVEINKDESVTTKKERSVDETKASQQAMLKTLSNFDNDEEDSFSSDTEDASDSITEVDSVIELPTIIPERSNEESEVDETSDSELKMFNAETSLSNLTTENDKPHNLMTRLSEYGTFGNGRSDQQMEDTNFNDVEPDNHNHEYNEIGYGYMEPEEHASVYQEAGSPIPHQFPMPLDSIVEEESDPESVASIGHLYFTDNVSSPPVMSGSIESNNNDENDEEVDDQNLTITYYTPDPNTEPNIMHHYISPVIHYSHEVVDQEGVKDSVGSYTNIVEAKPGKPDDSNPELYTYESDVDTGLAMASLVQHDKDGYVLQSSDPWHVQDASDSDSSDNSEDKTKAPSQANDSWNDDSYYTGYTTKNNEDSDLVYFDDKAAAEMSDSDIYTGGIFNSSQNEINNQEDMTKNNNTILHECPFERSNFWNVSSRPQMHHFCWRPQTRKELQSIVDKMCSKWQDGQSQIKYKMATNDTMFVCDESNNYNGTDDDKDKPSTSCAPQETAFTTQVASNSEYTEYNNDTFWTKVCDMKTPKDMNFYASNDFSKYDRPQPKEKKKEEGSRFSGMSYLSDVLFFDEDKPGKCNLQPVTASNEQNLYFNTHLLSGTMTSKPHYSPLQNDEDYQGGWLSTSKYDHNNNADEDTDSYTGCFKNEEELKPTHEGLFNGKASSFVFRKRSMNSTPNYCHNNDFKSYYGKEESSYAFGPKCVDFKKPEKTTGESMTYYTQDNSKSYYDKEESVYAFETKKDPARPPAPKVPQVFKVGGIVVRNNVEREVDYAKNIDMDLQEAPKPWVRYDISTNAKEVDTSSYAQNVSYDNLTGVKPWSLDDSRTPWRGTQLHERMKKNKESNNSAWTNTPDKVVKSVKSLGTYVRKWF